MSAKVPAWRLWGYSILTQAIILLGRARDVLVRHQLMRRPEGRVFDVYNEDRWECCDCGLVHDASIGPEEAASCRHVQPQVLPASMRVVGHCWPMRPVGYDYWPRMGVKPPSLAKLRMGR